METDPVAAAQPAMPRSGSRTNLGSELAEIPLKKPRTAQFSGPAVPQAGLYYHEAGQLAIVWRYLDNKVEVTSLSLACPVTTAQQWPGHTYVVGGEVVRVEGVLHTFMEIDGRAPFYLTIVYVCDGHTYYTRKLLTVTVLEAGGLAVECVTDTDTHTYVCPGSATAACVVSGVHGGVPVGQAGTATGGESDGLAVVVGKEDGTVVVSVDPDRTLTLHLKDWGSKSTWLPFWRSSSTGGALHHITSLSATTVMASDRTQETHLLVVHGDVHLTVYAWKTTGTERPRVIFSVDLHSYCGLEPGESVYNTRTLLLSEETTQGLSSDGGGCWLLNVYVCTATEARFVGLGGWYQRGSLKVETVYRVNGIPPVGCGASLVCFGRGREALWGVWRVKSGEEGENGQPMMDTRVFVTKLNSYGMGDWRELLQADFQPLGSGCENAGDQQNSVVAISSSDNAQPTIVLVREHSLSLVRNMDKAELLSTHLTSQTMIEALLAGGDDHVSIAEVESIKQLDHVFAKLGNVVDKVVQQLPLPAEALQKAVQDVIEWNLLWQDKVEQKKTIHAVCGLASQTYVCAAKTIVECCGVANQFQPVPETARNRSLSLGGLAVTGTASSLARHRIAALLRIVAVGMARELLMGQQCPAHDMEATAETAILATKLAPVYWAATAPVAIQAGNDDSGVTRALGALHVSGTTQEHSLTVLEAYLAAQHGIVADDKSPPTSHMIGFWPGPLDVQVYADHLLWHITQDGHAQGALKDCLIGQDGLKQHGYWLPAFLLDQGYMADLLTLMTYYEAADKATTDFKQLSNWLKGRCELVAGRVEQAAAYFRSSIVAVKISTKDQFFLAALHLNIATLFNSQQGPECAKCAVSFAATGLEISEEGSADRLNATALATPTLSTTSQLAQVMLNAALAVSDFDRAWTALSCMQRSTSNQNLKLQRAVAHFLTTMWKAGEGPRLCNMLLAANSQEWCDLLKAVADADSLRSSEPALYELLYSLHIAKNDFRNASLALYSLADRLQRVPLTPHVWERTATALAAAANALSLVPQPDQWLAVSRIWNDRYERRSPKRTNDGSYVDEDSDIVQVIDLPGLQLAYWLTKARLALVEKGSRQEVAQAAMPGRLHHRKDDTLAYFRLAEERDGVAPSLSLALQREGLEDMALCVETAAEDVVVRLLRA